MADEFKALVIEKANKIESLLKRKFGADGIGVGQRVRIVGHLLGEDVFHKIKDVIAPVRNRCAHTDFRFDDDKGRFIADCDWVINTLESNSRQITTADRELIEFKIKARSWLDEVKNSLKNRCELDGDQFHEVFDDAKGKLAASLYAKLEELNKDRRCLFENHNQHSKVRRETFFQKCDDALDLIRNINKKSASQQPKTEQRTQSAPPPRQTTRENAPLNPRPPASNSTKSGDYQSTAPRSNTAASSGTNYQSPVSAPNFGGLFGGAIAIGALVLVGYFCVNFAGNSFGGKQTTASGGCQNRRWVGSPNINLRRCAGTKCGSIKWLSQNTEVCLSNETERVDGKLWVKVQTATEAGWVSQDLLNSQPIRIAVVSNSNAASGAPQVKNTPPQNAGQTAPRPDDGERAHREEERKQEAEKQRQAEADRRHQEESARQREQERRSQEEQARRQQEIEMRRLENEQRAQQIEQERMDAERRRQEAQQERERQRAAEENRRRREAEERRKAAEREKLVRGVFEAGKKIFKKN